MMSETGDVSLQRALGPVLLGLPVLGAVSAALLLVLSIL